MSKIQFRLAYRTDAAGKYNATAPLEGNEDNMFIDADLSSLEHGSPIADTVIDLSDKGCLMVVADGMGGMNAGEVASDIAIKTVSEYFDTEHMAAKSFRDSRSRMSYMEDVVVAADAAIKADSRTDKEHEGMGSTIIMAWLCDGEICLTWCGDSRAYLFRPDCGFWQMSKDHSYVQGLVDEGKITPDEAFDHPYGNIITRSLGDPEKRAKADSVNFDVYEGDIFMLCSDGLSGVLRDHKTFDENRQRIDTENLEDIIAANCASMTQCRDELFDAAQRNDWYDNVTAILCEIVSGDPLPADMKAPVQAAHQPSYSAPEPSYAPQAPNPVQNKLHGSRISIRKKNLSIIIALLILVLGGAGFLTWWLTSKSDDDKFFSKCQSVGDYRTYLRKYPKGNNVELAQSRIAEFVADSANNANEAKGLKDPNLYSESTKANQKNDELKKGEPKTDKKGNDRGLGKGTDGLDKGNNSLDKGGNGLDNGGNGLDKGNNGLDKGGNELDNGGNGLNKGASGKQNGLTPAEGGASVGNGLSVGGNNPEEKLYNEVAPKINNNTATIEDCKKYLSRYFKTGNGANAEHWQVVAARFKLLYTKKIQACKTPQEFDAILNNHDALMKEVHLNGMNEYDGQMKSLAQTLKNRLQNGDTSSGRPNPRVPSGAGGQKTGINPIKPN